MTISIPSIFGNLLQNMRDTFATTMNSEWLGRIVTKIKSATTYLQEPRAASAFIFFANFGVLELSYRIAQIASWGFPDDTETQLFVKGTFQGVVITGLTATANIALVKVTGIRLNSLVITAIVATTFMVRHNIHAYLDD